MKDFIGDRGAQARSSSENGGRGGRGPRERELSSAGALGSEANAEARAAKARRLLYVASKQQVMPPLLSDTGTGRRYHIFLSHVWGTGQDQMRIIKQRLREMLPDVQVFLGARSEVELGTSANARCHGRTFDSRLEQMWTI